MSIVNYMVEKKEKSEIQRAEQTADFMLKLAADHNLKENEALNALLVNYRQIGKSKYYPDICSHYLDEYSSVFKHLDPLAKKRLRKAGEMYDSEVARTGRA